MLKTFLDWFHQGGWVLCFGAVAFVSSVLTRWAQKRQHEQMLVESRGEIVAMIQQARDEQRAEAAALEATTGEDPLSRSRRKEREYFALIRTMEDQKNRYKLYWLEQAREHSVAQGIFERAVVDARLVAKRAINLANHYLEKDGRPKIVHPKELFGPPEGLSADYRDKIEQKIAADPPEIDIEAELRRVGPPTEPAALPPAAPEKPTEGQG